MLIVSERPLFIADVLHPSGTPFEIDEEYGQSLLRQGIARHATPPRVLYETFSPQQNAAALREQGVTCLCVTKNRRDWLPKAIACYLGQSYQPRELLIIADGKEVKDLIPDREDIRLIHVEDGRNIGVKRNFGVENARGKYIAHWDDDDISAPDRLLDQVDRIRASGKPVTGYNQVDFIDRDAWWRYTGDDNFAPGSSLLYEKEWAQQHPFPPIQIGEDGKFVEAARERAEIVTVPSNGMLTATIHPGNTTPRILDRFWAEIPRSKSGLTVVIPSKTASNVRPCLDAIRKLEPELCTVVVDDGIDDIRNLGMVVAGKKPFIFSRNVNIGIRAAGRDDVLVLNDDALLKTPGGFSLLQKTAAEHPEFGVIAATTNAVGNRNQFNQGIGLREDPRIVCFIAVLIPRTALDKIGYMDERFTAYGFDDDDFCYRVRRAGLKIGIHDGCFVDHASLKSTFRGNPTTPANLTDGRQIFLDKWGAYPL
jgi:GT2 family glycosyltransferase